MSTHTCIGCSETLPVDAFYRHAETGKPMARCKDCHRARTKARAKARREASEEVLEQDRERMRENYYRRRKQGRWASPSAEKVRARARAAYAAHPEKMKANLAAWHEVSAPPGWQRHHWSYLPEHATDVIVLPLALHAYVHRHLIYVPGALCFQTKDGQLLDTRDAHIAFLCGLRHDIREIVFRA